MSGRHIADVLDYDGLVSAIRARAEELNISRNTIDDVAGLTPGYASKLLAAVPLKKIGAVSLGPLLGALGMRIVLVEDLEQMRRVAERMTKRNAAQSRLLPDGKHLGVTVKISLRQLKKLSRLGNDARSRSLSPRRRKLIARHAAQIRWERVRAQRERRRNAPGGPLDLQAAESCQPLGSAPATMTTPTAATITSASPPKCVAPQPNVIDTRSPSVACEARQHFKPKSRR